MKRNNILKILSVLLALLFPINALFSESIVCADELLTQDEEKVVLEQKLKQLDKRLKYLENSSEKQQEYLDTLNKKLDYLNRQYELVSNDCKNIELSADNTEKKLINNKIDIANSKKELARLDREMLELNDSFKQDYDIYTKRLRAIYVSDSNNTYLDFLLGSDSIEKFLIRLEMYRRVTKQDAELISNVKSQMDQIILTKGQIQSQREKLEANSLELSENKQKLQNQRAILFSNEEKLKVQKLGLEKEQRKADELLKSLNDKSQKYGEYRTITRQELVEIDSDIIIGDEKYQDIEPTTQNDSSSNNEPTSSDKQYLDFTYPCPSYTQITCGFGEYEGHSGCDFSTKSHENEKIVAAESGTVILVKLLQKSYGHYVVIRHDKTTQNGEVAYTLYAHNNDIIVKEGDYVHKGQQIAYSGTTGNSTGPHCHFEIRIGGRTQAYAKNPKNYLPRQE